MLKNLFSKYFYVQQHDISDCGAACLATISRYYGLKISLTKVREACGTDREGTSALGLIKAAQGIGFKAKGIKSESIDVLDNIKLPAIAHVLVDKKLFHFVVVYSVKKDNVIIADPRKGIVKLNKTEFSEIWTGGLIILEPGDGFRKGDYTKGMFVRFFTLLKPMKKSLAAIFTASIIYTALGLVGSFYIKFLFDDIIKNNIFGNLNTISLSFILLLLFQSLLSVFRSFLLIKLGLAIDKNLMIDYYRHVLKLPMSFFTTRKVGEIISRFMDASKIRDAISGASLTLMIDTIMAIAGGIILYLQNSLLFLVTLIVVSIYAAVTILFKKPLRDINEKQMEDNATLSSYLVESLEGIETIKAFHVEEKASKETVKKFDNLINSLMKGGTVNTLLTSLTGFVSGVGTIVILWIGTYQVVSGNMTAGQLLAFNALLVYFINPIKNLIDLQASIQTAVVASARLGEILDLEAEKSDIAKLSAPPSSLFGEIVYKDVLFRYGHRKPALKNLNFTISAGEKVAFVGESGSGKSTLVKLLMSFYHPEEGQISISGYNIKDLSLEFLRRRIALISQDTFLFSGPVKDSISLGVDDISMEEIINASKAAKAHDFIEELPLKYNTHLGENGLDLSGGQRQRISIARALLIKPDILIMDEATSNLDSITEKAIEETIMSLDRKKTIIIIAHRLSTAARCDRIFVMHKGEIIESGTHQQLLDMKQQYSSMWAQIFD